MSLSFGLSPFLLVLCLLAAAGLTYWNYRRTVPALPPIRRGILMALRFLSLFLVLFLLFEPIWRRVAEDARSPVFAVLVDDSQSLSLRRASDTGDTLDVSATVRQALRDLSLPGGDLRWLTFSNEARPISDRPRPPVDSLQFDGPRTNIAQALTYVQENLQDEALRGVLLISDGQYNTGRNPLHVAERYPVPIHTVVVGDTTRRRDVQIRRVTTNEIAYVDTELPIQVGLRTEDVAGEQVTVSLWHDGQRLAATTTQLPSGTAEIPIDLTFTPEEEGLQQLRVSVTYLDGEVTHRNNNQTFTVRVLESKRRLLLVGASPDPNLATTRQILQRDANVEVESFVQKRPGQFYEGAFPSNLDDVDVFVLVGFPGGAADPAVVQRIAEQAASGTPLLFMITQHTDLAAVREHLSDVLPAAPEAIRPRFSEATFVLADRGQQHPILDLPEMSAPELDRLPPLLYNESRWVASPDARVLATTRVRGVQLDDPLLVIRRRTGHRSAALLGTDTWRWKNLPSDLDALAPFWPSLLSNLIQWLSTPEDNRLVRVDPVEDIFGGGEPVELSGQVYNESLDPVDDASLTLQLTAPDSAQYPYTMEPVGNGRYLLDVGSLPEGTYRYTAEATRDGMSLGTDEGSFAVGGLTVEFKETRANVALMRQIAQRSAGTFLTASELETLSDRLSASDAFRPVTVVREQEQALWRLPWFLAVVVALLSVEWFLRKRSGMV